MKLRVTKNKFTCPSDKCSYHGRALLVVCPRTGVTFRECQYCGFKVATQTVLRPAFKARKARRVHKSWRVKGGSKSV